MRLLRVFIAGIWLAGSVSGCEACGEEPPPPTEPVAETPAEPKPEAEAETEAGVVVKRVRGKVEARRKGKWVAASVGDRLEVDEAIRSGPDSEVALAVGTEETEVVLREKSEISVREVTKEIAWVRLERGRMGADVKGKLKLQVEAKGSHVVAEASKGKFTVFNNGRGLVAIAAETAEVKLKTAAGNRALKVGQQMTITGDRPRAPTRIPPAVFLSVVWPDQRLTRAKSTTVRGKAAPGTEVNVNGKIARVQPDGTFSMEVALNEGENAIDIQAVDILGRKKRARGSVEVRRRGPRVKADSKELWK